MIINFFLTQVNLKILFKGSLTKKYFFCFYMGSLVRPEKMVFVSLNFVCQLFGSSLIDFSQKKIKNCFGTLSAVYPKL